MKKRKYEIWKIPPDDKFNFNKFIVKNNFDKLNTYFIINNDPNIVILRNNLLYYNNILIGKMIYK